MTHLINYMRTPEMHIGCSKPSKEDARPDITKRQKGKGKREKGK